MYGILYRIDRTPIRVFLRPSTHDKVLVDSDSEIAELLEVMDIMVERWALSFFSFRFSAAASFQIGMHSLIGSFRS
jgi:hypothetical protein